MNTYLYRTLLIVLARRLAGARKSEYMNTCVMYLVDHTDTETHGVFSGVEHA